MKKFDIEEIVEKLDDYFAGKSKLIFFVIAFVVVLYFCSAVIAPLCTGLNEYSQDLRSKLEKEYSSLANPDDVSASIEREKVALKSNESQKKELEQEKKVYTAKVGSFANKFFSSQDVNKHINEVANKASNSRVDLIRLTNNSKELTINNFEPMFDLDLEFNSNKFEPIIKYLYSLENTTEISDVRNLAISSDGNKLRGNINIVTWGFKNE